jgi:hypothetical protein
MWRWAPRLSDERNESAHMNRSLQQMAEKSRPKNPAILRPGLGEPLTGLLFYIG